MTVAFAMLVHDGLERAAQVARHWAERDCPVVIHVDARVGDVALAHFRSRLEDLDNIRFSPRFRCNWGTWSLVEAAQAAAELVLRDFPDARHVFLASGSCLPLRPVGDLRSYLAQHPETDFIESVTIEDVRWTMGGLDLERFSLSFPFGWKTNRRLFDAWVRLQRAVGYGRRIPDGLMPHLGSQWWCLTRETLRAILEAPDRDRVDRYFARVWIPDESYFQTLTRRYCRRIESRSLTLSKFDYRGKPHLFFDDHLQLLRRSDCFVARKIWPGADKLYAAFLSDSAPGNVQAEPNPGRIDRVFARAVQQRVRGRPGLQMAGRFPDPARLVERTAAPYSVFAGYDDLFADFAGWLAGATEMRVHRHLFAPDRAEFADGQTVYAGALSDAASLRDYAPEAFLRNLIWNTRGERQAFQFGPADRQRIAPFIAEDPNARVALITGAWAVRLFREHRDPSLARSEAARLQRREAAFVETLRARQARADIRIATLAEMLEQPWDMLQTALEDLGAFGPHLPSEVPRMVDLTGFDAFLQDLKNQGMNPYLVGDFHSVMETGAARRAGNRPHAV